MSYAPIVPGFHFNWNLCSSGKERTGRRGHLVSHYAREKSDVAGILFHLYSLLVTNLLSGGRRPSALKEKSQASNLMGLLMVTFSFKSGAECLDISLLPTKIGLTAEYREEPSN